MTEALGMLGAVAFACIPAGFICRAVDRKRRQKEREVRRELARREQAEISALYAEMLKKGVVI